MTDKQCRDRIVGVLSASMMPMEVEAECVRFLDKCLDQISWHPPEKLPPMHEECLEWEGEQLKYQISEPVLAYTDDGEMVTVRVSTMDGETSWFNSDGGEYTVTHWRKLPDEPEENANGI